MHIFSKNIHFRQSRGDFGYNNPPDIFEIYHKSVRMSTDFYNYVCFVDNQLYFWGIFW